MFGRTISLYRNAYSGLSRSTWLLSFVMLINRSGTMVIPFMTIYLTQPSMGYSISEAGVVMGIFGFGAVCGGFLGGRLTDRIGFHRVQLITLAGGGLLFMVLGQMKSYPLICGFTFLLSLINEAFRPANSTAIAWYSTEENRTRSFSLNRLSVNLGWAVGGAIGGVLASINYHLLFWVDGSTNILAMLLLRYYLGTAENPDTGTKIHPQHPQTGKSGAAATVGKGEEPATAGKENRPRMTSPYKDKVFLQYLGLTILLASCFFQLISTIPLYYKKELQLSEYMIGMLMAFNGLLIACFEMVLVFKIEGRKANLFYISCGAGLIGCSFLMLNILPPSLVCAFFCMAIITSGEITSMPFMASYWISRTGTANRGQYAGLNTMAWSTAQVIGPSVGAQVAQYLGFRTLWWGAGAGCLLAAVGYRRLLLNKRAEHE
ncbi:MAG TPA: MFS transporter [Puia sp.]